MEDSEVLSWTCCASQIPVLDLAPVATVTSSLPPVLFSSSGLKNCPASSIYEWRILRSYFRPAARPRFLCWILDLLCIPDLDPLRLVVGVLWRRRVKAARWFFGYGAPSRWF